MIKGCDANGHERCLPTNRSANSLTQAGLIAFTGALANDLRDHVFGKSGSKKRQFGYDQGCNIVWLAI